MRGNLISGNKKQKENSIIKFIENSNSVREEREVNNYHYNSNNVKRNRRAFSNEEKMRKERNEVELNMRRIGLK